MIKIDQKQQKILEIVLKSGTISSSAVFSEIVKSGKKTSLVTVKRALSEMTGAGFLAATGSGPSRRYDVSPQGRLLADIDAKQYTAIEPDKRYGRHSYNFDLWTALPIDIFTADELNRLEDATAAYRKRTEGLPVATQKKELERLVIELSWKSSRIEGNTYTLLDTEKLILENKVAVGHSQQEAQMILNHKDAFNYIREYASQFQTITRRNLEELHAILVKDLEIDAGLRAKPAGVTGSIYRPLDNVQQIAEAVSELSAAVTRTPPPYAKALLALAGIKYIQPFADGNKRTARLMANALLLAHHLCPLSYRSVDESEYREATLAFYELNSLMPLKKIFIAQYEFAAQNYAVK